MKHIYLKNSRKTELLSNFPLQIPLELQTQNFTMRAQTPQSRRFLVAAKTYLEQLNAHPNMSIAI